MNGLGRKKETNENKNQTVFTRETLGVVLVLFATLALVCLITRDAVFSTPGKYINAFLFGCFGYFAYAVTLYLAILGVKLIVGKKSKWSFKRKALTTICFFALALITHVITLHGKNLSFADYIVTSYSMAEGGFKTASGGGFFTAFLAYPIVSLLTEIGSYVVLGIVFVALAYFVGKDLIADAKAITADDGEKFKSSYAPEKDETNQPLSIPNVEIQGEKEYPISNVIATPVAPQPQNLSSKQKLFVNNPNDFALKTKRELSSPECNVPIKLGYSDNGLAVANVVEQQTATNLPDDADYKSKLDYIKTPPSIDLNAMRTNVRSNTNTANNYYVPQQPSQTIVSNYVTKSEDVQTEAENEVKENIPFIDHSVGDSLSQRAEAFGRYAEMEDIKPTTIIPDEEEVVFRAVKEEKTEEIVPPPIPDIPFIEENYQEQVVEETSAEVIEEQPTAPEIEQSPRVTNLRDSMGRSALFSDENELTAQELPDVNVSKTERRASLGFTSRVEADGNSTSRRAENIVPETKPEVKEEKPKKVAPPINREYFRPPLDLLENYTPPMDAPKENHEERMQIIQKTLEEFGINAVSKDFVQGPSITRYEIMMPAGISVKKVSTFDDDLKMRLASKEGVRIEAPIPGKNLVGIEVANEHRTTIGLREIIEGCAGQKVKDGSLMFALGKDLVGKPVMDDLAKGPHYLVAGATGSGKSVCLNLMIVSLIMRYSPENLRLILVDPKGVEFNNYEHIPHLMIDEIITEPKKTLAMLSWAYTEMERRFSVFREEGGGLVANIDDYNKEVASATVPKMPRIVIIIDELADLMETCKKDLESRIRAIAQKARAAGIHLVLATQRPSVDIITGTIKANLPSRVAFKVMNFNDSQTILGEAGAEKLLGNGDMLYKTSVMPAPERYQGAFISNKEVNKIVNYIKEKNTAYFDDELQEFLDKESKPKQDEVPIDAGDSGEGNTESSGIDSFFLKALWLAVNTETVSIAQLQRRFQIGYARAGGLVDKMERMGFVSPHEGAKARRVLLTREQFEEKFGPMSEN